MIPNPVIPLERGKQIVVVGAGTVVAEASEVFEGIGGGIAELDAGVEADSAQGGGMTLNPVSSWTSLESAERIVVVGASKEVSEQVVGGIAEFDVVLLGLVGQEVAA